MKTLRNSLLVAGGFAILVGALVLGGLQPQEVESQQVKTVNAQQRGAWSVGINGTPNVNVANSPIVQVGNTTANPVPVVVQNGNNADGTVTELVEFIELNVAPNTTVNLGAIGANERLVITDVIVSSQSTAVLNAQIRRTTAVASQVVSNISVPGINGGTYEHSYVSGIEFVAGESLIITGGSGGAPNLNWELRGYLETLPSSP